MHVRSHTELGSDAFPQMPVCDGLTATRSVRTMEGPNRNTPILALSANVVDADRARALHVGMNGFVSKPCRADKLREAIRQWIPEHVLPSAATNISAKPRQRPPGRRAKEK